jgi:hypothetical protein
MKGGKVEEKAVKHSGEAWGYISTFHPSTFHPLT